MVKKIPGIKIKIPFNIILIIAFLTQIIFVSGIVAVLSFSNSKKAVNDVARQLIFEISRGISEHLETFMRVPHQINGFNSKLLESNVINVDEQVEMERYFFKQIMNAGSITSIYFGNTEGGLVGCGREGPDGNLYYTGTVDFRAGSFYKYSVDQTGKKKELLSEFSGFDARKRPWYTGASSSGKDFWTDIYILFSGQDMAIAEAHPIYDENGRLAGVLSIDIFMSHLSSFLSSMTIGKSGKSYIIELDGKLVASSIDEKLFVINDEEKIRLSAEQSSSRQIRESALFLRKKFARLANIRESAQFQMKISDSRYFLQVTPFHLENGIDWLTVVVLPENDFMQQIISGNRVTLGIILVFIIISTILGIVMARRITKPLVELNVFSNKLADGIWEKSAFKGHIKEVHELSLSFNTMAGRLMRTLEDLQFEREFTNTALDAQRDTYFLFNAETGKALRWNKVFQEVSGYTDEEK